ncbi:MAG: aminomethyl-transferring glycine dehydrogenase subunit GcvPB [Anaerolineae bacterium]|nr:aminomethyl-transferring glycine dehydrogenase subunit GcvPB [Anaerolineae bacterium]
MSEKNIFELSVQGRTGVRYPDIDVPLTEYPQHLKRENLALPELSELDVVRHFSHLAKLNYSIDSGFYPLGSCTMKYNPKMNEQAARQPGFASTHPLQPIETTQGNLVLMYLLQEALKEISGFHSVSLQPAAGAQGEFVGVRIIRRYLQSIGEGHRDKILIPDSAHGTNPASASMNGLKAVQVPSDERGNIDLVALQNMIDNNVAGLMVTNPNTLGLFEENICEVTKIIHAAGGLVYGDGANMNALMGIAKPADLGIDVMHFNLHKTFSTPHGGGGPGSGPVGVIEKLAPFLPSPIVAIIEPGNDEYAPLYGFIEPEQSIGRVKAFHGQFGVLVRAFAYIDLLGSDGLRLAAEHAVLNANYLLAKLKDYYHVPYPRLCKHEFVVEGAWEEAPDIHALDISKRLMDYNFHPPTNYFPLIVHEALMIEPTETESKDTLDEFIEAMISIANEAHTRPELLHAAPATAPLRRLDELKAAKELTVCCTPIFNQDD